MLVVFLFVPLANKIDNATKRLSIRQKIACIDTVGTVLFLGTCCSLLLALTWGGQKYAWKDSKIIGLFLGFGLILICFCIWNWKQGERALIPIRVLRKRSICMGALVLFSYGLVMYVVSVHRAI